MSAHWLQRWWFGLAVVVALLASYPAAAINVFWDDAGGDAGKLWSSFGEWSPDGSVDGDDVFVGVNSLGNPVAAAANDRTLYDDATLDPVSLTVGNGADVVNSTDDGATNDFEIEILGNTTIGGAGSSIIIYGGDPDGLDTDNLTINDGGSLILNSTTVQGTAVVEVDGNTGGGLLDINPGGEIVGTGRIDLEEVLVAASSLLINSGTITANTTPPFLFGTPAAGTLQITATSANARFDWDGGGAGVLNARGNQTLDIDVTPGSGGSADPFSGTMNLSAGSTIDIAAAWELDTGTINANTPDFGLVIGDPNPGEAASIDGANWTMSGGVINVDDTWDSLSFDSTVVASGGTITNSGTLIFNAPASFAAAVDFNMDSASSSLVVNAVVNIDTPNFELDGAGGSGSTTINSGGILDLDVGAGSDVDFDHTINLNGGELDVTTSADTAWSLTSVGNINAAGGATSTINSAGETFIVNGEINVTANSTLNVNSVSEFSALAAVVIDAGSTLNMGTATYNGGSYTGGGIFRKGTATIDAATNWNVATVDLDDGTGTTLNANLTINADSIEDSGANFDSSITIADAALLTVNISGGGAWTVSSIGSITYNGNAGANTFLAGSTINLNGTLDVTGDGRTDAALNIGSTGVVNILTAAEPLRLSGGNTTDNPNRIAGGQINGPGILAADSGSSLHGFGTIGTPVTNVDIDFDGVSDLLANGGTLTVNGDILDARFVGTADSDGILSLTNALNTDVIGELRLNGGSVVGADIDNTGGIIRGFGRITNFIDNGGQIIANGGVLELTSVNADGFPFDPNDGDGSLTAVDGDILVSDPLDELVSFVGTINIGAGRTFTYESGAADDLLRIDDATGDSNLNGDFGRLNFTGGALVADAVHLEGQLNASAATARITAPQIEFDILGSNTINANLEINGNSLVDSGATFSGGGALVNLAGRTMTLEDGADVDVVLENRGTLVLGTSPGQTQGLDFVQTAAGTWNLELGGTGINDYDRITLSGLAQLGGTLNLSLLGPYVPTLDDPAFTILSAVSNVGTFASVLQPVGMPAGLQFDVVYNDDNVQLVVAEIPALLAGDYNEDGVVNAADYAVWRDNLGAAAGALENDVDGGVIGTAQYETWVENFGNSGSGSASDAAVPEPTAIVLIAGVAVALSLRRSCALTMRLAHASPTFSAAWRSFADKRRL